MGREVVRHMLDVDAQTWSVRRSKANWFRIMGVLAWAVGLARWLDGVQRWRSPSTTVRVHVLYLVLERLVPGYCRAHGGAVRLPHRHLVLQFPVTWPRQHGRAAVAGQHGGARRPEGGVRCRAAAGTAAAAPDPAPGDSRCRGRET